MTAMEARVREPEWMGEYLRHLDELDTANGYVHRPERAEPHEVQQNRQTRTSPRAPAMPVPLRIATPRPERHVLRLPSPLADLFTAWTEILPALNDRPELDGMPAWQWFIEAMALRGMDAAWVELEELDAVPKDTIGDIMQAQKDVRMFENKRRVWRLSGVWIDDPMTAGELYQLAVEIEGDLARYDELQKMPR